LGNLCNDGVCLGLGRHCGVGDGLEGFCGVGHALPLKRFRGVSHAFALERLRGVDHLCLSLPFGHLLDSPQRLDNCWVVKGPDHGGGDGWEDCSGAGWHDVGDGSRVVVPVAVGQGVGVSVEVAPHREGVVGERKGVGVGGGVGGHWQGVEAADGHVGLGQAAGVGGDWLDGSIGDWLDISLGGSLEWLSSVGDVSQLLLGSFERFGRVGDSRFGADQGGHRSQDQAQQLRGNSR